jgi:NhaA family Na+:H+ antiporter
VTDPHGQVFDELSPGGSRNLADTLRAENTGAILLLAGTVVALAWSNSPWRDGYRSLSEVVVGPSALHLDLTLAQWATDGLLAIFFFVVGLELKREMVDGQLRRPATAVVPILAAVGGMAVPAALYAAVNLTAPDGSPHGWAVPVATDIAFAVAVLTVFGSRLPAALRAFLLTLAVVDDLLGIVVIAVFYSEGLQLAWLAAVAAVVALFALGARSPRVPGWALIPLGVAAWAFMHSSGVHATIAGVVLGFAVPALARPGEEHSVAERYEHLSASRSGSSWPPCCWSSSPMPGSTLPSGGSTSSPSAWSPASASPCRCSSASCRSSPAAWRPRPPRRRSCSPP